MRLRHGQPTEAAARRERMVRALIEAGILRDPRWIAAFTEVPRHVFTDRYFRPRAGGRWHAVDSTDRGWLARVYSDRVLVTQLDDDDSRWETARREGPVTGVPTSSSSQPTIMAIMLQALAVQDGDTVLEIGTGTGYNAALLAHRLGAGRVTTVDVDPGLVTTAAGHLAECGYRPTCVATDGALGYPANAPYTRVLATCSVSTVPIAWLEQLAPGGLVVTTLNRAIGAGLVRITAGPGGRGEGRVLPEDGRFMPLRAHRTNLPVQPAGAGRTRATDLRFADLITPSSAFEFYAGLELSDVAVFGRDELGEGSANGLVSQTDGSWVRYYTEDGRAWITQGGPRRLWDLVEAAHEDWLARNRPGRDRFGITVDTEHQELWLDTPDGPHWPL